jgi:hypothetical protein
MPISPAEDLAERLAEGVAGVVGGGEDENEIDEPPAPQPGERQLEYEDDLPHRKLQDPHPCKDVTGGADAETDENTTTTPSQHDWPVDEKKNPLLQQNLPPPVTQRQSTDAMRPRRRLIRLVLYSLFLTGLSAVLYSLLMELIGAPQEPGVNLNSAKRLGYTQIENIPLRYIPREYDTELKRLIFIGDVHGMYTERKDFL